jgi:hypothetical protein
MNFVHDESGFRTATDYRVDKQGHNPGSSEM